MRRRSPRILIWFASEINNKLFAIKGAMTANAKEEKVLLTMSNIKYLVEGLDVLLATDLDGDKRARVIKLRDDLTSYINSIFSDYS